MEISEVIMYVIFFLSIFKKIQQQHVIKLYVGLYRMRCNKSSSVTQTPVRK